MEREECSEETLNRLAHRLRQYGRLKKACYAEVPYFSCVGPINEREHSGSVVECLTRDRGAAGSSLTGGTALWSLGKTHLS